VLFRNSFLAGGSGTRFPWVAAFFYSKAGPMAMLAASQGWQHVKPGDKEDFLRLYQAVSAMRHFGNKIFVNATCKRYDSPMISFTKDFIRQ
jgi:hypothetical protein